MSQDPQLRGFFDAVDSDKSGRIDVQELQAALGKGGFIVSLAVVAQLIRLHDRENDGRLDFEEFLLLHQFLMQVQAAFARAAGPAQPATHVSLTQAQQALSQLGFQWLEEPAYRAVASAFDPGREGTMSAAQFMAMVAFLKTATATYKGFDVQGQGRVTMSMNQFVYAAANTR